MKSNLSNFILIFALFCILWNGCVASTPKQESPTREVPTRSTSTSATSDTSADGSLPSAARIDRRGLFLLEDIFRTQLNVNQIDNLYATTRRVVNHIAIVSNGELDVVKAFVAQQWIPVVLLQYGSKRHLWTVMGYDNASGQIQLGNPLNSGVRIIPYADFEGEWAAGSAQKCALVTPIQLSEKRVRSILKKYIPAATADRVTVRSR